MSVIIEQVKDFDLSQTLECGQCFNFYKIKDNEYVICALGEVLHAEQVQNNLILHNCIEANKEKWIKYFDLDRDYGLIKNTLIAGAPELKEAIEDKWGIHILNQDFLETLMSFIISQNKQIPHIKQIVGQLSRTYGTWKCNINDTDYYTFPDLSQLLQIGEEGFRQCRTGFRAPYLQDAVMKVSEGLNNEAFRGLEYEKALEKLKTIKGVGDKVANCVLLFGLGYRSAFPVDVWVKRVMEEVYFHNDTKKEVIMEFAKERYGEFGGYAQQYLFFHRKSSK